MTGGHVFVLIFCGIFVVVAIPFLKGTALDDTLRDQTPSSPPFPRVMRMGFPPYEMVDGKMTVNRFWVRLMGVGFIVMALSISYFVVFATPINAVRK